MAAAKKPSELHYSAARRVLAGMKHSYEDFDADTTAPPQAPETLDGLLFWANVPIPPGSGYSSHLLRKGTPSDIDIILGLVRDLLAVEPIFRRGGGPFSVGAA